jgi:ribonuclease HI
MVEQLVRKIEKELEVGGRKVRLTKVDVSSPGWREGAVVTEEQRVQAYESAGQLSGLKKLFKTAQWDCVNPCATVSGHPMTTTHKWRQQHPGTPPPLAHNWTDMVYTDGSVVTQPRTGSSEISNPMSQTKDNAQGAAATQTTSTEGSEGAEPVCAELAPGIRAGVYIPQYVPAEQACSAGTGIGNGRHIQVQCKEISPPTDSYPACTNTINRAELAAIHTALEVTGSTRTARNTPLQIATDSLTSMYQVMKQVTKPQDMKEHRHATLLSSIANNVRNMDRPVHIWKVKSHIGIFGNEVADQLAVCTSKGQPYRASQGDSHETHEMTTASNQRESMAWPYLQKEAPATVSTSAQGHTPLPNMGETLKSRVIQRKHLGSSNTESVYYKAWKEVGAQLSHKHSHRFMTSTKVTDKSRKLALQYRYGLLPTQKNLYRYKPTSNSKCPLCGEEDRKHHSVSACPALSKAAPNDTTMQAL